MWRTLPFCLVSGMLLAVSSCSKNETVIDGGGINSPAYTSTLNSFTYVIDAVHLSTSHTIPLTFTRNRLFISAAVSNNSSGSVLFTILDSTRHVIRSDTFKLPGMYQVFSVFGVPKQALIPFRDFTGRISYTLVADTLIPVLLVWQFPNTEGARWTYARYDSILQRRDTVVVDALGLVTLPDSIVARIWRRTSRAGTDTNYVSVTADTVRILQNQWYTKAMFVFPLYLGKGWRGSLGYDTSFVAQTGSVGVPAGTFHNGFLVDERWHVFNDHGSARTWLVPFIGIVKMSRSGTWPLVNESWELLTYAIPG